MIFLQFILLLDKDNEDDDEVDENGRWLELRDELGLSSRDFALCTLLELLLWCRESSDGALWWPRNIPGGALLLVWGIGGFWDADVGLNSVPLYWKPFLWLAVMWLSGGLGRPGEKKRETEYWVCWTPEYLNVDGYLRSLRCLSKADVIRKNWGYNKCGNWLEKYEKFKI